MAGPAAAVRARVALPARPDAKLPAALIVAIHAPYGVLDFDGPSVPPSRPGRLYLDQVGIFPGSLDAEMRQMWLDLLRWMVDKVPGESR